MTTRIETAPTSNLFRGILIYAMLLGYLLFNHGCHSGGHEDDELSLFWRFLDNKPATEKISE